MIKEKSFFKELKIIDIIILPIVFAMLLIIVPIILICAILNIKVSDLTRHKNDSTR